MPGAEFLLELVRHDADHRRLEPLPVEVVQQAQQVALDTAEGIALDVVDDSDRVLQVGFRGTGQGDEHFLGDCGVFRSGEALGETVVEPPDDPSHQDPRRHP